MTRFAWSMKIVLVILLLPALMAEAHPPQQDPQAITLPATRLTEYVGQYRGSMEPDVVDAVTVSDSTLHIEGERMQRMELIPESPDHFFVPGTPLRVTFTRDSSGKVVDLTTSMTGPRGSGNSVTMVRFSDKPAELNHFRHYTRSEAMVPMRDGVKLHLVILRPQGSENEGPALPFLMERTPYGVDGESSVSINASKPELA
ncbi:MAG TPA: sulfonate ABC transporter permease, partial [Edaphobacter sp.]|nr:sulfonate ABC transporter permease [Edaphobacter sp.]